MKKWLCLLLILCLLPVAGLAAGSTDTEPARPIPDTHPPRRAATPGISPTTGLPLVARALEAGEGFAGQAVTGRYYPLLVQIDATNAGAGRNAPWGLKYADIIYEFPLYPLGAIRLSALFSDLMPTAVGAVRSARVGMVWTLGEWDAAFVYFGYQDIPGSSVPQELTRVGATFGEVRFSGTDGYKPWSKAFVRRKDLPDPYNVTADVAALSALVPEKRVAREHAFLFTDDHVLADWEPCDTIEVIWGNVTYDYTLRYDEAAGGYQRVLHHEDGSTELFADHDTGEVITFQNVIVQSTLTTWNAGNGQAPITHVVGSGNAEYFQCGRHMSGVWNRPDLSDQTVYYTLDGQELSLQRGRTLIILAPTEEEPTPKEVKWN